MVPSLAASARCIPRAVSVEPVNATPAVADGRPALARCCAVTREEAVARRRGRRPGEKAVPRLPRSARSARLAWRRPRCPRPRPPTTWPVNIARGKFHGLMHTNTPRPCKADLVVLAGRARADARPGEVAAALRGVVAAKVHRLANLGDGIGDGLAGFANGERHHLGHVLLEQVGHGVQTRCARVAARIVPARGGTLGAPHGRVHVLDERVAHRADRLRWSLGSVHVARGPSWATPPMSGAACQGGPLAAASIALASGTKARVSASAMPAALRRSGW